MRRLLTLSITILLISSFLSGIGQAKKQIELYWTDPGVYLKRPKILNDWLKYLFQKFDKDTPKVLPDIPPEGEILIPMPSDRDFPQNNQEWQEYKNKLYQGISKRIEQGIKNGVTSFDIRTVQDIAMFVGYFDRASRQPKVFKFISAFLEVLNQIKKDFSKKYDVKVRGIWGSNGAYGATEAIAHSEENPVDSGVIVDGRAFFWSVIGTYEKLGGNLSIINTSGDAPSLTWMVANYDTATMLKGILPNLRVFFADPEGLVDVIPMGHISTMINPDAKFYIKEYQGEKRWSTGKEIIAESLKENQNKNASSTSILPSDKKIILYPREKKKKFRKSDNFPPFPSDDHGGGGGAGVGPRPGPLPSDPGGVLFDKENTYLVDQKGLLTRISKAALGNRPNPKSTGWEFEYQGEEYDVAAIPLSKEKSISQVDYRYDSKNNIAVFRNKDEILTLNLEPVGNKLCIVQIALGKVIYTQEKELAFRILEAVFTQQLIMPFDSGNWDPHTQKPPSNLKTFLLVIALSLVVLIYILIINRRKSR